MIFLQLFTTFCIIGLFNFGGGYAMISLIQQKVVMDHAWISMSEFIDMIAIAESTPGPLAINMATYAGYKVASIPGAIVANLGLFVPAIILICLIARFVMKYHENHLVRGVISGLQPVTIGLIFAAALLMVENIPMNVASLVLGVAAFALTMWTKVHPALTIVALGVIGAFFM